MSDYKEIEFYFGNIEDAVKELSAICFFLSFDNKSSSFVIGFFYKF